MRKVGFIALGAIALVARGIKGVVDDLQRIYPGG